MSARPMLLTLFKTRNNGSDRVSMTWRAMSVCPCPLESAKVLVNQGLTLVPYSLFSST